MHNNANVLNVAELCITNALSGFMCIYHNKRIEKNYDGNTDYTNLQILHNRYQNLNSLFAETDKLILKFTCNYKGPRRAKTILENNNKFGEFTLPNFKTYTTVRQ